MADSDAPVSATSGNNKRSRSPAGPDEDPSLEASANKRPNIAGSPGAGDVKENASAADGAKGESKDKTTTTTTTTTMSPAEESVSTALAATDIDVVMSGDEAAQQESGSKAPAEGSSVPPRPTEAAEAAAGTEGTGSGTPGPTPTIQMRALIVTQDASIIIGKAGKHVNEIRDKSGARITISESIPGNPERIMTVAGPLDAVSKAFGLIVRRINDEPFDQPSLPGSRAVTIRFIIPNSRMGSVIGKGGQKIKEIQEASGARVNASETMLPGSTERVLSVSGVADAIHIAVYYVGNILQEHQERNAGTQTYRPTASTRSSRPGYVGAYGEMAPAPGPGPVGGDPYYASPPMGAAIPPPNAMPGTQTQQIFIPNDLVGCIIGKGGSKINEIRQMSQSQIKIMEPGTPGSAAAGAAGGERLVTITGQPANIQMAVGLLYQRLEQEKMRLGAGGGP